MAKRTNDLQTLHRKLKIEKHEPHLNLGVNSGAPDHNVFETIDPGV